jgi:hypothetical protein
MSEFRCKGCALEVKARFGRSLPQIPNVVFIEDCYLIMDPFSPDKQPLCVGSHCVQCQAQVCTSPSCSIFYAHRFCRTCLEPMLHEFPLEIKQAFDAKQ